MISLSKLLEISIKASIEAGFNTLEYYNDKIDVKYKSDQSPLTLADISSHNTIIKYLNETNLPILSEEGASIKYIDRKDWETFWLIDPLDGTKEFIKKNGEFTINIALIKNGSPIMGVVYAPVLQTLYFASENTGSFKAEKIDLSCTNKDLTEIVNLSSKIPQKEKRNTYYVVGSRSHLNNETQKYFDFLKNKYNEIKIISKGSSLKICMVAEGSADEYPRFGPTMEWDTAAGHAIVKYAGKTLTNNETKNELNYNKENLLNPYFIVK